MNKASSFDVIVVGGGAIGMTSAWRLAQTGRRVLLLDKGPLGSEASSAAAGMLGAQLEVASPGPFYHLCIESRALYKSFVDELFEETGIQAQLKPGGIYRLAFTEDEVRDLKRQLEWQTACGQRAIWMDGQTLLKEEPAASPCLGALWLPDDANVHAERLSQSLAAAVRRRCTVKEGADVTSITRHPQAYEVCTPTDRYHASNIVIAAGAWAERLLTPLRCGRHIQPVKGQMMAIRPRTSTRLHHTLVHQHAYLVPKDDGTIIVGATEMWDKGFDKTVTIDGLAWLTNEVHRIAPGLADATFERTWTGLRPGSPGKEPTIGQVPGSNGLHLAVGHFRNGILLSPITGRMLVQSVENKPWPDRWAAFLPTVGFDAQSQSETAAGCDAEQVQRVADMTSLRG